MQNLTIILATIQCVFSRNEAQGTLFFHSTFLPVTLLLQSNPTSPSIFINTPISLLTIRNKARLLGTFKLNVISRFVSKPERAAHFLWPAWLNALSALLMRRKHNKGRSKKTDPEQITVSVPSGATSCLITHRIVYLARLIYSFA